MHLDGRGFDIREKKTCTNTGSATSRGQTRRGFGRAALGSALGEFAAPAIVHGRNLNEKLNIALIGVGGRGAANLDGVKSENIVALCDVFEPAVARAAVAYPHARRVRIFASCTTTPENSTRSS